MTTTPNYEIVTEGNVPDKIYQKARDIVRKPFKWRKTKRKHNLLSYRITQCFRLVKIGNTSILRLMDHKHYDHYLTL